MIFFILTVEIVIRLNEFSPLVIHLTELSITKLVPLKFMLIRPFELHISTYYRF